MVLLCRRSVFVLRKGWWFEVFMRLVVLFYEGLMILLFVGLGLLSSGWWFCFFMLLGGFCSVRFTVLFSYNEWSRLSWGWHFSVRRPDSYALREVGGFAFRRVVGFVCRR